MNTQPVEPQNVRVGKKFYRRFFDQEFGVHRWIELDRKCLSDDGVDIQNIDKYPMFTNVPDHFNYQPVVHGKLNLYNRLDLNPVEGSITWSMALMRHIFGDQLEYGLDYIQLLLTQPTQKLPVIALVSKENETGKSTFFNWVRMLFADNAIVIGNSEFTNDFNSIYADKLVVMVDEMLMNEKDRGNNKLYLQRLKKMVTDHNIIVNPKGVQQYQMKFHGHFMMTSNSETSFMHIEQEDKRFWVRKIPQVNGNRNANIEADLLAEVPAFIHFILNRELHVAEKQDRLWFNMDDLTTDALTKFKSHNHSPVYVQIRTEITEWFDNEDWVGEELYATPKAIKSYFFSHNNQVTFKYIESVLMEEFGMVGNPNPSRKKIFNDTTASVHRNVYTFHRADFVNEQEEESEPVMVEEAIQLNVFSE